jgi:predicted membrane protein
MWPIIMITIGVYLIGKATTRKQQYDEYVVQGGSTSEDFLQATTIFSGSNKVVLSKNFKGGNITTVFGGTELNFMQADINGEAVLDITTLFGGVEIVVPASWDVKLDVNTIFGGIEDKRTVGIMPTPGKVLIIKGSCTFGGVDLKSF